MKAISSVAAIVPMVSSVLSAVLENSSAARNISGYWTRYISYEESAMKPSSPCAEAYSCLDSVVQA